MFGVPFAAGADAVRAVFQVRTMTTSLTAQLGKCGAGQFDNSQQCQSCPVGQAKRPIDNACLVRTRSIPLLPSHLSRQLTLSV